MGTLDDLTNILTLGFIGILIYLGYRAYSGVSSAQCDPNTILGAILCPNKGVHGPSGSGVASTGADPKIAQSVIGGFDFMDDSGQACTCSGTNVNDVCQKLSCSGPQCNPTDANCTCIVVGSTVPAQSVMGVSVTGGTTPVSQSVSPVIPSIPTGVSVDTTSQSSYGNFPNPYSLP